MSPEMWEYCVLDTMEVRVVHDEVGVRNRAKEPFFSRTLGKGPVALCDLAKPGKWTLSGLRDIVAVRFWLCPERRKHRKL